MGAAIIVPRIDPVGGMVPGRILTSHDRNPSRRTNAHGIKVVEPHSLSGQSLHVGRSIKIIQWVTLWLPFLISQERYRRVHHSHVVYQKDDNIG